MNLQCRSQQTSSLSIKGTKEQRKLISGDANLTISQKPITKILTEKEFGEKEFSSIEQSFI